MFALNTLLCLSRNAKRMKWSIVYRSVSGNAEIESSTVLLSKKSGLFQILSLDANGKKFNYEVSKTSLYQELGLTVRDLRFQHPIMLNVRNKRIIVRLQQLKAIVCPDILLLIDPSFDAEAAETLDNDVAQFWKSLPSLLAGSVLSTSNLPFEYKILEAMFTHILCNFSATLAKLEPEITELLSNLTNPTNVVVDRSLNHLLLQSNSRLNSFSTEVNEFCEALEDILEQEQDIRNFCISSHSDEGDRAALDAFVISPANQENIDKMKSDGFEVNFPSARHKINLQDEMELLMDSFLRDAEEIDHRVKELKDAIDNSSTAILINLDSHRNMLLRFELELTIGMFSCNLFGLIGVAFGMNLQSSLEENPVAFWYASGLMVLGAGLLWRYLLRLSRKRAMLGTSNYFRNDPPQDGNGTFPPNPPLKGRNGARVETASSNSLKNTNFSASGLSAHRTNRFAVKPLTKKQLIGFPSEVKTSVLDKTIHNAMKAADGGHRIEFVPSLNNFRRTSKMKRLDSSKSLSEILKKNVSKDVFPSFFASQQKH